MSVPTKEYLQKQADQLGMPRNTASMRLKKMVMFDLVQKLGLNSCFQCGKIIKKLSELTVEHKIPWLNSDKPAELFFDLDNIAFSHSVCNQAAARRILIPCPSRAAFRRGCRCDECCKIQREYRKIQTAKYYAKRRQRRAGG